MTILNFWMEPSYPFAPLLSPLAGQVGTGFCPNPFSRLLSDESGKGALFAARNLFSTILKLGSTANPKLALRAQTVGFVAVTPR